jgi:hypothetical protein
VIIPCADSRADQTNGIVERSRFANCRTSSTTLLKILPAQMRTEKARNSGDDRNGLGIFGH